MIAPLMLAALVVVACEAHFGDQKAKTPPPAPPPAPAPVASAAAAPAPTPAAPAPSKVTMKDGKLNIPGNIVFETGKAVIKPESEPTLQELKAFMDQNTNYTRIRIEGHTDNVGKPEDNLKLSQDRALAVVQWLSDHAIAKDRCLAVGFGDAQPIASNATDDGKAQNRRTEFHIAEIVGKPFLGRDETRGGTIAPGQTAPPVPVPKAKK
jgi:outer membrane protein OmpA-like peptidoglycan-associated protein